MKMTMEELNHPEATMNTAPDQERLL
jgi:hypothetical protein